MTHNASLQEALMVQAELQDIQGRLETITSTHAVHVAGLFDMLKNAKDKIKDAAASMVNKAGTMVQKWNEACKATDVVDMIDKTYKVHPDITNSGTEIDAVLQGKTVKLTLVENKTKWQVQVDGTINYGKTVEEIKRHLASMVSSQQQAMPAQASFEDILHHSRTIMRCRAVVGK